MEQRPKDDFEKALWDINQMIVNQRLNIESLVKRRQEEIEIYKEKSLFDQDLHKKQIDAQFELDKKRAHLKLEVQARAWEINKQIAYFFLSKAFRFSLLVGLFLIACKLISAAIFLFKIKYTYAFYNQAGETVSHLIKDVVQEIKK